MSISMGQLVNDAKELVARLKEREKNVDQVVIKSNALAKKVDAIQQLENELINLNEKANHRSKVAVLSSIQKENKVIKLLQQENEELKESLEEHQSVLEIIMSKYRQQMLQLIQLKKQQELSENFYKSALLRTLQEKTDQIAEMTELMRKAIDVDEKAVNENEEKLQSLLVENRGLKELLKIKARFGVREDLVNLVDKEIQTDDDHDVTALFSDAINQKTSKDLTTATTTTATETEITTANATTTATTNDKQTVS